MTLFRRLIARFIYHGTCPNCGHAITYSMTNGSTYCSGCKKRIEIHNGKPTGWR